MNDNNKRTKRVQTFSQLFNTFAQTIPADQKKKVLINHRIKQVNNQFKDVTTPFILNHTNSVYLLKSESEQEIQNKRDQNKGDKDSHFHFENSSKTKKRTAEQGKNKPQNSYPSYQLVVYVDSSIVAAELNAQRELIKLKYLERFHIALSSFDIRISKGSYKKNYPFLNSQPLISREHRTLTLEEDKEIDQLLTRIKDKDLRESYAQVLRSVKENPLKND